MPDGDVGRVLFFDTTLRDGEQAPGIALTKAEKVEIAEQLARLKVDVLEAGFAVSGDGEFAAVREIATSVRGPIIASLARVSGRDEYHTPPGAPGPDGGSPARTTAVALHADRSPALRTIPAGRPAPSTRADERDGRA